MGFEGIAEWEENLDSLLGGRGESWRFSMGQGLTLSRSGKGTFGVGQLKFISRAGVEGLGKSGDNPVSLLGCWGGFAWCSTPAASEWQVGRLGSFLWGLEGAARPSCGGVEEAGDFFPPPVASAG